MSMLCMFISGHYHCLQIALGHVFYAVFYEVETIQSLPPKCCKWQVKGINMRLFDRIEAYSKFFEYFGYLRIEFHSYLNISNIRIGNLAMIL